MPRKTLSTKERQELRNRSNKTIKAVNGEIRAIATGLAHASCALYSAGMAKEADELRARCHHFVNTVVTHPEFMRTWAEWAFENPGQAMRDVAAMGAKLVKVEGEINHKQFIMVSMEDPDSWKKKVIEVAVESESKEVIPWKVSDDD